MRRISSNFQVKLHRQSQSVRLGCSQHTAKKWRGFKVQSPNSVEPLPGHLWWTELPSVLGHEQAQPPLFVQGGGKSYGSPCIKCTCWTCVQPWWGDNVTPSFTTQIIFFASAMHCKSMYVAWQQDCYQLLGLCITISPSYSMCMWYYFWNILFFMSDAMCCK